MTLVARRSPLAAAASDDAASGMPPTAREWRHFTASSDGTRIECLITDFPRAEDEKRAREDWFILVHAHPKLGGCRQMMLPLARSLAARGHGSVCVALRGTSESLGSSTWRGSEAEGEDVLAACALAANGTLAGANANARCHLVGYSYGGTICGYALKRKHPNVASYIAIGYPRGSYGCGLYGVGAKWLMRDHFDALAESEDVQARLASPATRKECYIALINRHFDQPWVWALATAPPVLDLVESIIGLVTRPEPCVSSRCIVMARLTVVSMHRHATAVGYRPDVLCIATHIFVKFGGGEAAAH